MWMARLSLRIPLQNIIPVYLNLRGEAGEPGYEQHSTDVTDLSNTEVHE